MVDKVYYKGEVKVDENILLYKRENSEKYYCRILMPKSKGYKRKSTKTSDLGKALVFAN